jgi:molybdopterin-containing oxidoreductase family iron-sulfur binding subunit
MVACPYHTRSFNWWKPEWPAGMETTLNPDVSIRTRGVVEKCNFCVQRLQAARAKASAAGKTEIDPADYVPACVEACPSRALSFGDAADEKGELARLARDPESFRLLAALGTGPKVVYRSSDPVLRERLSRTGVTRG